MQTLSRSLYPQSSPTKYPLFKMLWCDSVAPFGKPVVPEVYWMLMGSSKESCASRAESAVASSSELVCDERIPLRRAQVDDLLEAGEISPHLLEHRFVVTRLERWCRDDEPASGLAQHVAELVDPVRRIDVHEDGPDPRRGVLGEDPSCVVRRPDAHPVALGRYPSPIRPIASESTSLSNWR